MTKPDARARRALFSSLLPGFLRGAPLPFGLGGQPHRADQLHRGPRADGARGQGLSLRRTTRT